jgi:hypothetical protein
MAHNNWILDVLADLRTFALENDFGALAQQLDVTSLVASAEILSQADEAQGKGNAGCGRTGSDTGGIGRHGHA